MPTDLNLFTLAGVFRGLDVASNKLRATSVDGVRRCFDFGLLTVDRKRGTLHLTDLGRDALCGYALDRGGRLGEWADEVFLFKACTCCGAEMTRAQWEACKLIGYQPQFGDDGEEDRACRLELRNCTCGTTLSVEVPR